MSRSSVPAPRALVPVPVDRVDGLPALLDRVADQSHAAELTGDEDAGDVGSKFGLTCGMSTPRCAVPNTSVIASTGHALRQAPWPMQSAG